MSRLPPAAAPEEAVSARPAFPEPDDREPSLYLQPGQMITAAHECRITTILGSCVAVSLYDAFRGVGGMNHYLLPRGSRQTPSPRFGDVALPRLLDEVMALGASHAHLKAKVFGGARMLTAAILQRDLGGENVALALAFLREQRIPVVAQDVGGTRGRKLVFRTVDGAVWLRRF